MHSRSRFAYLALASGQRFSWATLCGAVVVLASVAVLSLTVMEDEARSNVNKYTLTFTNNTDSQPFSPVAVIVHRHDYRPFKAGRIGSKGLRILAESGEVAKFLAEQRAKRRMVYKVLAGQPVRQHQSLYKTLNLRQRELGVTVVAKMMNANDAVAAGTITLTRGQGQVESTQSFGALDAGSEVNNQEFKYIPGECCPDGLKGADGKVNLNLWQKERMPVRPHPGLVEGKGEINVATMSWTDPVATLTVKRYRGNR